MDDLLTFFRNLFPVFFDFFNIEFPFLGMTVFQVCLAGIFISIGFRIIRWVLFDSPVPKVRDVDRARDKE